MSVTSIIIGMNIVSMWLMTCRTGVPPVRVLLIRWTTWVSIDLVLIVAACMMRWFLVPMVLLAISLFGLPVMGSDLLSISDLLVRSWFLTILLLIGKCLFGRIMIGLLMCMWVIGTLVLRLL